MPALNTQSSGKGAKNTMQCAGSAPSSLNTRVKPRAMRLRSISANGAQATVMVGMGQSLGEVEVG
ncbi:hypothetical protein D3C80_1620970 [compost metagenome]